MSAEATSEPVVNEIPAPLGGERPADDFDDGVEPISQQPAIDSDAPPPKKLSELEQIVENLSFEDELDEDDERIAPAAEADAKPAAVAAGKTKKAEAESAFDADLLADAEHHGFTPEDAKEFGTPAALKRAILAMDRKAVALYGKPTGEQPPPLTTKPAEAAQPPIVRTPAETKPAETGDEAFEKLKLDLDPNLFDENALKAVNGLNDHYHDVATKQNTVIKSLKDELAAVEHRFQSEDNRRTVQEVDQWFDSLGEEFVPLFGKGGIHSLAPNSNEVKNRIGLRDQAMGLYAADQALGRPALTNKQYLNKAALLLHGDIYETISRKKLTEKVSKRAGQTVAAPTGRRTKQRSPQDAAVDNWNKKIRELTGVGSGGRDDSEDI